MDTTNTSGVTVVAHVGPHAENFKLGTLLTATIVVNEGSSRKKRGRPRKYKPDEFTNKVLSPLPLSSSAPPATMKSYEDEKKSSLERPINSEKRYRNKVGAEKLDDWGDCFTGSSLLPHVITVNIGEDISTKITEFSLQGPRSVCVLCGNGVVSNVTIRHPGSSGGTFTYEGLFEILSFSGSFNPVEILDSKVVGRSSMMTISLAGADGRVIGGLIGGLTIAASPIKIIVASFLLGYPLVLKPKKQKTETPLAVDRPGSSGAPAVMINDTERPTSDNPSNWEAIQIAGTSRKATADINISLQG